MTLLSLGRVSSIFHPTQTSGLLSSEWHRDCWLLPTWFFQRCILVCRLSGTDPFYRKSSPVFSSALRVNLKCPPLLDDELLVAIGEKHNKSTAQVALRFNVQRGVVVIPKSFNPERIKHNFQASLIKRNHWLLWHLLHYDYQFDNMIIHFVADLWFFTQWRRNESHWSPEQRYSFCGATDVSWQRRMKVKLNLKLYNSSSLCNILNFVFTMLDCVQISICLFWHRWRDHPQYPFHDDY